MEIDVEFYEKFWGKCDWSVFNEWSENTKEEWQEFGEPWEVLPTQWDSFQSEHWDAIHSNTSNLQ